MSGAFFFPLTRAPGAVGAFADPEATPMPPILPPAFLGPLDPALCAVQSLAAGERVALKGQATDRMMFVAEGRVRVAGIRKPLGAGDVVALRDFFGASAYGADLIALGPARLAHVPRSTVRAAMEAQDPLTWTLARVIAQEALT